MKTPTFANALNALAMLALAFSPLAGCAQSTGTPPAGTPGSGAEPVSLVKAQVPRDDAPQASADDLDQLAEGNSAFAIDLYQALRDQPGNLFFSPYSISTALAMTYAGARGETETQMAQTLHFSLPQERLHPAFNALDLALTAQPEKDKNEQGEDLFQLHIANSLWGQQGYTFLPEFLEILAKNYGAGMRLVDFANQTSQAARIINQWVSQQTNDKIKDVIPEDGLSGLTRLVLVNAIYFNARWQHPFQERDTQPGPFNRLDGSQVEVPMMSQSDNFQYTQGDLYQAIALPYTGKNISMLILLPQPGQFEAFEAGLNQTEIDHILSQLQPQVVKLHMPKFTFDSRFNLSNTLVSMGMPNAFAPPSPDGADFSAMDGKGDLFIGNVFHKAFIAVDEKGTEAAAATAVEMRLTAVIMPEIEVTIDRPFIFMILDNDTGSILFLGRVLDPGG